MLALVQLLQAVFGDMSIDLGGGKVAVTQQHLHHPQIGAMIQQMCGKRMTQGV